MSVIPPTIREVERNAEDFQRMLDAARARRMEGSSMTDDHDAADHRLRHIQRSRSNEDQPLIDDSHLDEDAPPPNLPAKPTPPSERASTALSTIEQGALHMAEEARAAATAVELIAKMIRADADTYADEVTRLSSKYCARVADYLRQCQDIQASFQLKKEDMIQRAQQLGPILENREPMK